MSTPKSAIAACLINLGNNSGEEMQIFPAGEIAAPLGSLLGEGPWYLDADSAAQLIAAVAQRKNDILIDYEHHSLSANENGHTAQAAGWIGTSSLVWRDDGLYAKNPSWTAKAAAMIDADEYRYSSPVFAYDKKTKTITNILSVALTNTPAIDNMKAVSLAAAMANYLTPETSMDESELMERLRYLLNLPITITPEEMKAQLDKLKTLIGADTAVAAASLPDLLRQKDEAIAALKAATPDPAKYVPVEALLAVQQQRQAEAEEIGEQAVAALIAAHPAVIIPALVPWAKELGKSDMGKLEAYIASAKPIAALTTKQTGGKPAPSHQAQRRDATAIAACATAYQQTQAGLGFVVDDISAIAHVTGDQNV